MSYLPKMDATPAPLDPREVKAGATVTLARGNSTANGTVTHVEDFLHVEELGRYRVKGMGDRGRVSGYNEWTLIDHQPAPEPEPEFESACLYRVKVGGQAVVAQFADPGDAQEWSALTPLSPERRWFSTAEIDDIHEVRPLVVIDPADVDVEALAEDLRKACEEYAREAKNPTLYQYQALRALAHLGIEVAR